MSFRLKIYEKEANLFPVERHIIVQNADAVKILNKLSRHYALEQIQVEFSKRKNGSFHSSKGYAILIRLPKGTCSIGLINHEFAHYLDFSKRSLTNHDSKFFTQLKRVYAYVKKKEYFFVKLQEQVLEAREKGTTDLVNMIANDIAGN